MAEHVAPVLTIPQARALLAGISPAVDYLVQQVQPGGSAWEHLSARERRSLHADIRSLLLAAESLRRVLPPTEGTP